MADLAALQQLRQRAHAALARAERLRFQAWAAGAYELGVKLHGIEASLCELLTLVNASPPTSSELQQALALMGDFERGIDAVERLPLTN